MTSFLEKTAAHLLEHYGSQLHQTAVVFPNKRAGLFLSNYLKKRINGPIWMPKIYNIEEFMEELSGLQTVSGVQLLFRFYEAYCAIEKEKAEPFGDFANWAQVLLHDLNEMDQQLVDPDAFFSYLHEVRQLENWNTAGSEPSPLQNHYIAFWKKSALYYAELKKQLLEQKEAYGGLVYRIAHERTTHFIEQKLSNRQFVFAGFNALTMAEEKIITQFTQHKKAEVLWDADEFYLNNPEQESGLFLRKHLKNWPAKHYNWVTTAFTGEQKKINVIGVAQQIGQTKVAGQLLRALGDQNDLSETALVLADENLLQPMLQSLPPSLAGVNITMGHPLKNTKVTNLFSACIGLFLNRSDGGFYYIDLLSVVHQTHFQLLFTSNEQEHLRSWAETIKKNNLVHISAAHIPDVLKENSAIQALFAVASPSDLLNYLLHLSTQLKQQLGKPQEVNPLIEQEYLLSYYQLFNRLIDLNRHYNYIDSFKTLKSLLTALLSSEKIDFTGEPLTGLQVMGMLETRNLHFKHLIVLSVNEGTLPMGKSQHTFVPYDVKLKFGMPAYREKDAMFAYHFYRLIQKAEHIHLLYNTETDEFGSGEKSRFITQMKYELAPLPNIDWTEKLVEMRIPPATANKVHIAKTPQLIAALKASLERGLSPTGLSTFLNCPLDYYYRYVLGLKDQEEVEETIEAGSMGSVIHEVLEASFLPYLHQPLTPEHLDDMLRKVDERTATAFSSRYFDHSLRYGKNLLAIEVVKKYLHDFLQREKKQLKALGENTYAVHAVEAPMEVIFPLQIGNETLNVKLRGKADRVDEVNGIVRVVDYKTGNLENRELTIERVEELFSGEKGFKGLQLMTYAYLYHKNHPGSMVNSGIYSFRKIKSGFMQLQFGKETTIPSSQYALYEEALQLALNRMLAPEFPLEHHPQSVYCKFCID